MRDIARSKRNQNAKHKVPVTPHTFDLRLFGYILVFFNGFSFRSEMFYHHQKIYHTWDLKRTCDFFSLDVC